MQIDAIINVIAVIVLPCITFIVGKELEKRQNKEDLIMEFYRPMIEEFRSLDHLYETLSKGISENSLGSYFNTLLEFDKNHTLLIITNIDRKLTKPMRKIIDDLIPTFDKIEEKRQQKLTELLPLMEIAYSKILEDHSDGATKKSQLDKRKFMPQVYEGLKWNLWRDDIDQAKQKFEEIVKGVNDVIPTAPPVSTELAYQLYKVFSEIYVKEMTPIREDLVKIGTSLKSTVSEEILPIMKKRMETIGK